MYRPIEGISFPGEELPRRSQPKEGSGPNGSRRPSSAIDGSKAISPRQGHQNLVFSDPVAFRYLEEDRATVVLERRRRLQGYEIYVVEQWACSRVHPTFIIATYTGDLSHSILVGVLSVPIDENTWSSRLKVYFKAVSQFHARKKETPLGTLMVTNLSGFPSALTVIAVPDGDVKKHREDFIVNENLKRMGCSGRAALNLQPPQASTVAKYHHLYRTSDSVPLYASVIELVKLCQTALTLYGKLLPAYVDGLLCDVTEKAINDWWSDIGTYIYNIEPSDGILGPTTVAALLGLLMGAHNRLKATGAPVGKEVFDLQSTKRAIGVFQKSQRIESSRRLDRQTLDKLHRATAKTASGEGWNVQKAVKSTVAELSGKGGEMVMGIVGARDKAGIAEIETLDIDRLAQVVVGPRLKWLWQGKPPKPSSAGLFGVPPDELNGKVFSTDDQGNFMWTSQRRDTVFDSKMARSDMAHDQTSHTGEGRSGFGRLRDAVGGLRSHQPRLSKEDAALNGPEDQAHLEPAISSQDPYHRYGPSLQAADKPYRPETRNEDIPLFNVALADAETNASQVSLQTTRSAVALSAQATNSTPDESDKAHTSRIKPQEKSLRNMRKEFEGDRYHGFLTDFRYEGPKSNYLRRSQSAIMLLALPSDSPRENRNPRHLSFSAIEDSILDFGDAAASEESLTNGTEKASTKMAAQEALAVMSQRKAKQILYIERALVPFVETCVNRVEDLDREAQQHLEELNNLYYENLEEYQTLRATSTDLVGGEKSALTEGLRRVEALGQKLDYELDALDSRVQEVEDGVNEFERNVTDIEARVRELFREDHGRVSWFYQFLRFFGTDHWLASKT